MFVAGVTVTDKRVESDIFPGDILVLNTELCKGQIVVMVVTVKAKNITTCSLVYLSTGMHVHEGDSYGNEDDAKNIEFPAMKTTLSMLTEQLRDNGFSVTAHYPNHLLEINITVRDTYRE